MDTITTFAIVRSHNTDPFAVSAASNFVDACQDMGSMATALAIASEAPGGVLDEAFLKEQASRTSLEVSAALKRVVDLFRYRGDDNIDFGPKSKTQMEREPRPRALAAIAARTTDPVAEGRYINQIRLHPFQRYVGALATANGDMLLVEAA